MPQGMDDAIVIPVRLDVEGAKRDLAGLKAAGSQAASAMGGGGSGGGAGGGGGGGSKGGARTPGPAAQAADGGRSPLKTMGLFAAGFGIGVAKTSMALNMAGQGGFGGAAIGGLGAMWSKGVMGGDVAAFGRQYGAARAERAAYGYGHANARASLQALDQTESAFAYAIGAGFMEPLEAKPWFEFVKGEREKVEQGKLDLRTAGFIREEVGDLQDGTGILDALKNIGNGIKTLIDQNEKFNSPG